MPSRQTSTRGSSETFYNEGSHNRRAAANPRRPLKYDGAVGTNTCPTKFASEPLSSGYTPAPSSLTANKVCH